MTPPFLVGAALSLLLGATDSARALPAPPDSSQRAPKPAVATPATSNPAATAPAGAFVADSIVVEKGAHRLSLYHGGRVARSYLVALGRDPVGPKERRGDGRTPEGLFHIDGRNARSRYHLALHVSYPDAAALARARTLGVSPGGDIMIHGLPNGQGDAGASHREEDWTEGCVAVTDDEIEEIWRFVPLHTPIRIKR
ncbi:MAG: murein L,D-transpeptidase family protein [Gemmatimonadaceae bacterium]